MFQAKSLLDTESSPAHRRAAAAVTSILTAVTVWSLALNTQWPELPAFMPSVVVAISAVELITGSMLIGQFAYSRFKPLAWLAAAYLFSGIVVIPFILTFPGAFAPNGLLGAGPQTTTWMWILWHAGFPLLVLCYVAQLSRAGKEPTRGVKPVVLAILAGVLSAVVLSTWLATVGHDLLPPVYDADGSYERVTTSGIGPALAIFCLLGLWGVWRMSRFSTVLNLWLAVALFAFMLDIGGALGGGARYSSAWYIARIDGLVSAVTILAVFLIELNVLYGRVAAASERSAADNLMLSNAEAALVVRTQTLQTAFDHIDQGISAFDGDRRLVAWNRRFFDLFGFPDHLAKIGAPYAEFVRFNAERQEYGPGDPEQQIRDRIATFVQLKPQPHRYEVTRRNGMVIEVNGSPIPAGGFVRTYSDITKRKQAENELLTAKTVTEQQLIQAQKMEAVGQLTGGLAHDFNNLLGIIVGNIDLLLEELGEAKTKVRTFAENALKASLRGAELIRHLLAFSRRQPLQPKNVDVNELATLMTQLLSRLLGEQIEIRVDTAPDGVWPVTIDPSQLESALANIATNALDAMPQGGVLTFRTRNTVLDQDYAAANMDVAPGEYVLIEISDTGSGIPPDVLERVFEPFFTTKAAGRGTGLGLSMVYGFVKQSGGHVKIYSEVGRGTVIRIYLPRAAEEGEPMEAGIETSLPAANGHEVILAVDDNAAMRQTVVQQLKSLGYDVIEAENAAGALELLEGGAGVDLLFTDVVMPGGMSGQDLARKAREKTPNLKVLFTSGFPEAAQHGFTLGTGSLLTKPYRKHDLARKLREMLDA